MNQIQRCSCVHGALASAIRRLTEEAIEFQHFNQANAFLG
jgi:hypothetical protein